MICPNYLQVRRLVKRLVIRRMLLVLILILLCEIAGGIMDAYSILDRRKIREEQIMTREMLNTRARNQGIFIKTFWNHFSPEDRNLICEGWAAAQYDLVEPKCPDSR